MAWISVQVMIYAELTIQALMLPCSLAAYFLLMTMYELRTFARNSIIFLPHKDSVLATSLKRVEMKRWYWLHFWIATLAQKISKK